jgi:hypothetical protein
LRLIRVLLAILLTLALFWASPRLGHINSENNFLEATVRDFLVDHVALTQFSGEGEPHLSVRVTTPADTSTFHLLLHYQRGDTGSFQQQQIPHVTGTLDLFSVNLPSLPRGSEYHYYVVLQDSTGQTLARLPEKEDSSITMHFMGTVPVWLIVVHVTLLFLAALFAILALIDTAWPREEDVKLKKLSQKVLTSTVFMILGGLISSAAISKIRYDVLWAGWPFGHDLAQTFWAIVLVYWIFLTLVFKGTIFGLRSKKNLIPTGGAVLLTLLGVILMVATYLMGINL